MKTKNMKIKKEISKKDDAGLGERIENFLHSESAASNATKFLLMTLATGSIVFGGAVLPGILKVIKELNEGFDSMNDNQERKCKKRVSDALGNMKRRNFIKIIKDKNGKVSVKLTNKGMKRVKEYSFKELKIKKPEKWDGKWRILIFDIPATPADFNGAREALRRKIKKLGFFQVQKSVWIYPYECEDELLFIAEMFGVQKYVEMIVAKKILHEKELKKKFKL